MADLVLGVAKSLVEGTLTRVQSAIAEELQLRKSTRRDLVFITGEFQMMQSYLSTTSRDNVKNSVVSTWVTQFRDLAYDVEDGIEFIVHLDPKSDCLLRVIPSFIAPARPLDEAVVIVDQLKARVQDVRERSSHYNLIISDPDPIKPVDVKEEEKKKKQQLGSDARDRDLEALASLITRKTSDLQVISVWVPGGDLELEATSTIREAFDNPKVWGNNFKSRAWVKLAEPFNNSTNEFVGRLLQQLEGNKQGMVKKNQALAAAEEEDNLRKVLKTGKYLVVLEDESTKNVLDDTFRKYFPDNGNGSRVVVITRNFHTATLWTGRPYIKRFWADFSLCVLSKEGSLIGRDLENKELREYLAKARTNALHVISVWGMAGAGKSALVRNLYQDKAPKRKFEKHGWIDVSYPFDLGAICRSLFLQLNSYLPHKDQDIFKECHSILKYHRCLVVIDNLQSKEDWNAIEDTLAFRRSESIVIVITNDESVAIHCANREEYVFNVKALDEGAAFDLFKSEVARDNKSLARHDVEKDKVLQPIISTCGGLPKVIVAISEYLAQAYEWSKKAKQLGDKFIVNLETRPEFTCLRDLFLFIHNYFRSGPDYLKPCMFYLSIFPKSQIIRRRRLVMRWIAEGYSKDMASGTAEQNGEEIFAKIIELSMIQPQEQTVSTGMRMVRCQVSAFFHEYIITRPKEENVTFALEIFSLKGRCRQTTGRTGRHLVIEESWERDRIVFDTIDFSRLRSLTVFGKWEAYFVSESMKVLRVLDLENASGVTNKDLKTMLKLLPRLKFLSLRGCSEISHLPDSVCDLRQLQILDVRYTSIVAMPASITQLKKLQYLRVGTTTTQPAPRSLQFKLSQFRRCLQLVGVKVETGVGKLTTLHTLGVVNVGGAGGKDILNELKNLTQLRKIGLSGVCRKNRMEFCSAISDHSHLQSLSVWLKENNEDAFCDMAPELKPPKELQSLKLYGPVKKLPTWIIQLNNIRKLNLELDILSTDDIEVLGELKELCILRLLVKPNQGEILKFCVTRDREEELCYKKLKVLEIASRSNLHITIGKEAMKNLELLKVQSCSNGSELQFDGLKDRTKLKQVWVICSQDQALKDHLENQFADWANKPVLKLENIHASTEASIGRHNNIIASTRGNSHTDTSTSGSGNIRVTTGGSEHAHGPTTRNDQIQTTTGGNGHTQTQIEDQQPIYLVTTPAYCS